MIIWTYESRNAPENYRWAAYIKDDSSPHTWPIRFNGRTEDEARNRALAAYEIDREKREATIAARKARRKTS